MGLIGLAIIGVILYFVFRNKDDWTNKDSQKPDESVELLKQRYINGEIDEEQYKKMLEVLKR
ncbi:MAG: hypothetical protein PWP16_1118 [Eubacteriaceae bacterium]|jgi:uncharacterized membrane protein|nr:hypothetical protein [Eubacteriaceae bacterium]MDN5307755.1 hypothetical protein [Eubacteriaceae bacterium]